MTANSDIDIGFVVEVNGERALVELHVDTTVPLALDYFPGQPGSHIKIAVRDRSVIGIVSSISMNASHLSSAALDPACPTAGRKIADCILIGTMGANGGFIRGVAVYPTVGQIVRMVGPDELKSIFSEYNEYGFSFGRPSQAEDQRAFINVDRFFGQHIAVVGTTGCGKSCTVVSILQEAIRKYPDAHIIVLDLHGEYASAFPEKVTLIEADKVELPYWLLSFDEFQDLTIDMNEFSAKNQITILRDALVRAREGTVGSDRLRKGERVTADSPVFFQLEDMLGQIRNWNIQMVPNNDGDMQPGPLYGEFDRFLLRLDSKVSDPRFRFMFSPSTYTNNDSLVGLLRNFLSIDTGNSMAVVDLSGVPTEAVGVVAAVVSRIVFEFNLWNPERDRFPILLVLEEAHNYVPNRNDYKLQAAKTAIERITKEGRKYGIGTIIVSQRPKELSETVLSQCNSFIAMRLTNPEDQAYVRKLVPDSLSGLMDMLPSLRTGEALILGDCVALPTRVMIDCPNPKPMSSDVEFAKWWSNGIKEMDVDRIIRRWRARRKDL
ncbi:MAG: ATP-binding protein [candidate division WOR-3 bacterium]|nr:ATP-binding protein [candidate division WOR-3 bacterium]